MIDFRYHMVSLAAVLIALSMGVVLGAGPLNDDIGNTLTNEVTRLRQDKDDLRRQLTQEQRTGEAQESFGEEVLPQLVSGVLDGTSVAVVRLPESDDTEVAELRETLELSGASVEPTVSVAASWVAGGEDAQASRERAASEALSALGRSDAEGAGLDEALGAVLGGRGEDGMPAPTDSQRTDAFERLSDAGLVSGDAPTSAADVVLVVAGPAAGDPQDSPADADPAATASATRWVELAAALDARSAGAVLTSGPVTYGSGDASPVTVARADSGLSEGLSTVDTPESAVGRADVVLGLDEQTRGDAGHYGLADDASAAIPEAP